jgi:hypothetical protein
VGLVGKWALAVKNEVDYTKYDESELVEVFGRMDPRRVPVECARIRALLIERGYVIRDGRLGPGVADHLQKSCRRW